MVSGCGKGGGFLDRIEEVFEWTAFEALLVPIHASTRGAPGSPPLAMFKILLLQQWHTLSDPSANEAVRDRLSFRRWLTGCCWRRTRRTTPRSGASARRSTSSGLRLRCLRRRTGARPHRQARHAGGRHPDRRWGQASAVWGGGINPRDSDARVTMKLDGPFWLQGASGGGRSQRPCAAGRDDVRQCP